MSVPNHRFVIDKLVATGIFDLPTHEGQAAFTDAAVSALHGLDPNWGHLKKTAAQTHIHGHGEDAALYLHPNGRATAVDFIGGAGGPNPQAAWQVDQEGRYTAADWLNPTEHGNRVVQVPQPSKTLPKGEAFALLQALNAFYAAPEGLQRPGGLVIDGKADMEAIAQWFYQMVIEGVSLEDVKTQIRASHEWRSKHP